MHPTESPGSVPNGAHTLVLGGGVIGLTTALWLRRLGQAVTVVDPGRRAGVSSWAGGGILSPLFPWQHPEAANTLARRSLGLYPELAEELREKGGVDPELRTLGMTYADFPSKIPLDRNRARQWAHEQGRPWEELEGEALTEREPETSPVAEYGFRLPGVACLRTPRLVRGLQGLVQEEGAHLLDGVSVREIRCSDGAVTGVTTDRGVWPAHRVVVAAGPWSRDLLRPLGMELPVDPIKGVMLLLNSPRPLLGQILMAGPHYLIPRPDNRILVGSTQEDTGFDDRIPLGSARTLAQAAVEMVPACAELALEDCWAGLRPGSPDDCPFVGPVPCVAGLFVNTGHFRNGIVQAPASAELLASLMVGEDPVLDPGPYRPSRTA